MRGPPCSTLFPYTTLFRSCWRLPDAICDRENCRLRSGKAIFSSTARAFGPAPSGTLWSIVSGKRFVGRSEEHTSELQSLTNLVCRLLLEKKKIIEQQTITC